MKRAGTVVFSLLLAITLLYLSFRKMDWGDFVLSLKTCDWRMLSLSALVGALMPACRSLRWRRTVTPFAPKVKRIHSILSNYTGYLVNMAIPFSHEAVRCVIMHNVSGKTVGYDRLTGVAVMERACDALCILILFIITAVFSRERYLPFILDKLSGRSGELYGFKLSLALVSLVILVLASVLLLGKLNGRNRVCTRICRFFSGVWEGFRSIGKIHHPWCYAGETVLLWFIYWLQFYLGARAVGATDSVGAMDCLFLTLAASIASFIPVPGGFGAFHFMMASSLSALCSVPWNDALTYATLVHESQALLLIVIGTISGIVLKVMKTGGTSSG